MKTLELFYDPFELFSRVNARPNWLRPFVIVTLLGILAVILMSPVIQHVVLNNMPQGLDEEVRADLLASLKFSKYYGIILAPIYTLLKWSILAFFLFSLSLISGAEPTFRKTLSVLGHASIIMALDAVLSVVVVYARGLSTLQSPEEIPTTVLSLSNFISTSGHPVLRLIMDNIGILSIWYLALLVIGVSTTMKLSKIKSTVIVATLWVIQTGFLVGLALLTSRYSSLTN